MVLLALGDRELLQVDEEWRATIGTLAAGVIQAGVRQAFETGAFADGEHTTCVLLQMLDFLKHMDCDQLKKTAEKLMPKLKKWREAIALEEWLKSRNTMRKQLTG
jgi:hypothetical protein